MYLKKKWCPEQESNQRHRDFQSLALPTELSGQYHIYSTFEFVMSIVFFLKLIILCVFTLREYK